MARIEQKRSRAVRTKVRKSPARVNSIPERRKKSSERRRNEAIVQFPIITTQGICVRSERRKIPDRRMSNIVVREARLKEEVFETLFSDYLKYKERMRRHAARRT